MSVCTECGSICSKVLYGGAFIHEVTLDALQRAVRNREDIAQLGLDRHGAFMTHLVAFFEADVKRHKLMAENCRTRDKQRRDKSWADKWAKPNLDALLTEALGEIDELVEVRSSLDKRIAEARAAKDERADSLCSRLLYRSFLQKRLDASLKAHELTEKQYSALRQTNPSKPIKPNSVKDSASSKTADISPAVRELDQKLIDAQDKWRAESDHLQQIIWENYRKALNKILDACDAAKMKPTQQQQDQLEAIVRAYRHINTPLKLKRYIVNNDRAIYNEAVAKQFLKRRLCEDDASLAEKLDMGGEVVIKKYRLPGRCPIPKVTAAKTDLVTICVQWSPCPTATASELQIRGSKTEWMTIYKDVGTSFVVRLEEGEYGFRVRAENKAGLGPFSEEQPILVPLDTLDTTAVGKKSSKKVKEWKGRASKCREARMALEHLLNEPLRKKSISQLKSYIADLEASLETLKRFTSPGQDNDIMQSAEDHLMITRKRYQEKEANDAIAESLNSAISALMNGQTQLMMEYLEGVESKGEELSRQALFLRLKDLPGKVRRAIRAKNEDALPSALQVMEFALGRFKTLFPSQGDGWLKLLKEAKDDLLVIQKEQKRRRIDDEKRLAALNAMLETDEQKAARLAIEAENAERMERERQECVQKHEKREAEEKAKKKAWCVQLPRRVPSPTPPPPLLPSGPIPTLRQPTVEEATAALARMGISIGSVTASTPSPKGPSPTTPPTIKSETDFPQLTAPRKDLPSAKGASHAHDEQWPALGSTAGQHTTKQKQTTWTSKGTVGKPTVDVPTPQIIKVPAQQQPAQQPMAQFSEPSKDPTVMTSTAATAIDGAKDTKHCRADSSADQKPSNVAAVGFAGPGTNNHVGLGLGLGQLLEGQTTTTTTTTTTKMSQLIPTPQMTLPAIVTNTSYSADVMLPTGRRHTWQCEITAPCAMLSGSPCMITGHGEMSVVVASEISQPMSFILSGTLIDNIILKLTQVVLCQPLFDPAAGSTFEYILAWDPRLAQFVGVRSDSRATRIILKPLQTAITNTTVLQMLTDKKTIAAPTTSQPAKEWPKLPPSNDIWRAPGVDANALAFPSFASHASSCQPSLIPPLLMRNASDSTPWLTVSATPESVAAMAYADVASRATRGSLQHFLYYALQDAKSVEYAQDKLTKEDVDMEALRLASEQKLKDIGLTLGARLKIRDKLEEYSQIVRP